MYRRGILRGLLAILVALLTLSVGFEAGAGKAKQHRAERIRLKANVATATTAAAKLRDLAARPMPADHTGNKKTHYKAQTALLTSKAAELEQLAAQAQVLVDAGDESLVSDMAAMNMQFLALQSAVQNESRKYQTLSNAAKARHDIAMNAIRNIK